MSLDTEGQNIKTAYYLLNIPITALSFFDCLIYLKKILEGKDNIYHQIVTLNTDNLRIASINREYYEICKRATLVLADGIGVISLIKNKYGKTVYRITGNDIFSMILKLSNTIPIKISLVGSSKKVLTDLINKLNDLYPQIKIASFISPSIDFEFNDTENREVIELLKSSEPDILLIALGCPRQEIWLSKHKDIIKAKINIGVGAVFDFYSGEKRRSPKVFQTLNIEWLWRLLTEPKRLFKRYIIQDIPFYIKLLLRIKLFNNEFYF